MHRRNRGFEAAAQSATPANPTHIVNFDPWKFVWDCAFPDKYKAPELEKYLQSPSGRTFAKKRP